MYFQTFLKYWLTDRRTVRIISIVESQSLGHRAQKKICGSAGIGRQARLRGVCSQDVWVQVPPTAPVNLLKTNGFGSLVFSLPAAYLQSRFFREYSGPIHRKYGHLRSGINIHRLFG